MATSSTSIVRLINVKILKAFFPPVLGTVVEYYDYTLYGFCAGILAEYAHFFS